MKAAPIIVIVALLIAAGGCVQRTIRINSQPQGALVFLNDEEVGRTPTVVPFTFYGEYDVRLELDGHQTLNTSREAKPPLHDMIGVDLIAEAAPWKTEVELDWMFQLEPLAPVDEELTVGRGRQMRAMLNAESREGQAPRPEAPADEEDAAPPTDE